VKQSQSFPLFIHKNMKIYAVDFETYYDKSYSVTDIGYWHYCHHEKFDAYMVSIVGDDGNKFVGSPREFDWECISGTTWLSHNANFDSAVFERLKEDGIVPKNVAPAEWHDTADLVTYLGYPRALKNAMEAIYKIEVSKATRDSMCGKTWDSMTPEFKEEVKAYALKDSEACVRIWKDLSNRWPEQERKLSQLTRAMCAQGLPINADKCETDIRYLETRLWETRKLIPWADNEDAKVLSPKALAEECRIQGIRAPLSLAQDSEDFDNWKNEFSERYPFAQAMSDYRRINALLLKYKTMRLRIRPNGFMGYGMKYFGAHTGRWSGDTGFNVQNMPRANLFDVNLRNCIEAPAGKTLVVCDLSNIEPRCLAVLSEDTGMLNSLRSGMDIYEAHARATLDYKDNRPLKEGDPLLRQVSKVRCFAGDTPILTNLGYLTTKELRKKSGLRVWDGLAWVDYDHIQFTGLRAVEEYLGERFTPDHPVFTSNGEIEIGKIFKGYPKRTGAEALLRRNPPGGEWADLWRLANFVVRSLKKEWCIVCKSHMRTVFRKTRRQLQQLKTRFIQVLQQVR